METMNMNKLTYLMLTFVLLLGVSGNAAATFVTVDGDPSEWFTNTSTWMTVSSVNASIQEDQCTAANLCNGGFLGPGYGGQLYDVEFLATAWDADELSILIITGLPHNNGAWAPGDIAIDFGKDGTYEYGIETTGNNGDSVGTVYSGITWGTGLWGGISGPTSILGGTVASGTSSTLAYTGNGTGLSQLTAYGDDGSAIHYAIEATVSLDHFDPSYLGQNFSLHWTMDCGNDALDLDPSVPIPEPTTLALLGIGLLAIPFARRRKRKATLQN